MSITTDNTTAPLNLNSNEIRKCIPKSIVAHNTTNPIRNITDSMKTTPNPLKPVINLGLGDPSIYGNLNPAPQVIEALKNATTSLSHNGYPPAFGTEDARRAIADRYNRLYIQSSMLKPIQARDVTITSGCSGALEMCFNLLASQGDRILLPKPGFSFYQTACDSRGILTNHYALLPNKEWEIDLQDVERLLSSSRSSDGDHHDHQSPIRAWLINNPSNPCGSVYSKKHLEDCKKLAEKYSITIISDEIYEDLTFEPCHFYPLATLEPINLPMLTVGGLAKRFLVPGWRCGWIILHDNEEDAFKTSELRKGLIDLAGVLLGCCSLVQGAIPEILSSNPAIQQHNAMINEKLKENAMICYESLQGIPNLYLIKPQGAMYMMIGTMKDGFDFTSDIECCKLLMEEESVACLPGCIFGMEGCYIRLVFCAPPPTLEEAGKRMKSFFERHLL